MYSEPRRVAELRGLSEEGLPVIAPRPILVPEPVGFVDRHLARFAGIKTRGNFARAFLAKIGAQVTRHNLIVMMAWMQAEGDAGRFNPLNSTKDMPGATVFNWVGVKNYPTFDVGVDATAITLNYGASRHEYGYDAIRDAMRKDKVASVALAAVEESAWGTGGLASRVLEETGAPELLTNSYLHHRLAQ